MYRSSGININTSGAFNVHIAQILHEDDFSDYVRYKYQKYHCKRFIVGTTI